MTYKTLVRKSDSQWMKYSNGLLSEENHPIPANFNPSDLDCWIDWSLYELEEVYVIRENEIPGDEEIVERVDESVDHRISPVGAWEEGIIDCHNYYKSQIIKP